MILVAGGTGRLGTQVVRLLTARGLKVRVPTRNPEAARYLASDLAEIVPGDVEKPETLRLAVQGVETVVSAVHGFTGVSKHSPRTVDWLGNRNLIQAAQASGVKHFILISMHGATRHHPMELFRMKCLAEEELQSSGLEWTIIRPTAYMETWSFVIGEPLLTTGKMRIFGRGKNPMNFVSVDDVARFIELAVTDPAMCGTIVEVGGPENLTLEQFVQTFEKAIGKRGMVSHIPLALMRLMFVLMRLINPTIARQIQAGIAMDTFDFTMDPAETYRHYPSITPTRLAEIVRRDYMAES